MNDAKRYTDDGLMDVGAVAAYTTLSVSTIRKRAQAGTIPFVRIGRRVLFRRADIDQWIDQQARAA
jgi:excisionase family DNA binding protein